jgi:hypothetical protein
VPNNITNPPILLHLSTFRSQLVLPFPHPSILLVLLLRVPALICRLSLSLSHCSKLDDHSIHEHLLHSWPVSFEPQRFCDRPALLFPLNPPHLQAFDDPDPNNNESSAIPHRHCRRNCRSSLTQNAAGLTIEEFVLFHLHWQCDSY